MARTAHDVEDPLLPSAVHAIGRTPLVELSRLTRDLDGRILAKMEYLYSKTVLKKPQADNVACTAAATVEKGLFSDKLIFVC